MENLLFSALITDGCKSSMAMQATIPWQIFWRMYSELLHISWNMPLNMAETQHALLLQVTALADICRQLLPICLIKLAKAGSAKHRVYLNSCHPICQKIKPLNR